MKRQGKKWKKKKTNKPTSSKAETALCSVLSWDSLQVPEEFAHWGEKQANLSDQPPEALVSLSKVCCGWFYFILLTPSKCFSLSCGLRVHVQKWFYISAILYLELLWKRKCQKSIHSSYLGAARLKKYTVTHDLKINFKHTYTRISGNSRFCGISSSKWKFIPDLYPTEYFSLQKTLISARHFFLPI